MQRSLVKEDLENISGLFKQEFSEERTKYLTQIDENQKTIQQLEVRVKEFQKKLLEQELKEKSTTNELKQEHEEMIHRMKIPV